MKGGYIGGPEFAGITTEDPPLLWGVENLPLYEKNIQAFKDSLKHKSEVESFLSKLESEAGRLKNQIYSPELKEFDRHFTAFKTHEEKLGEYVRYLLQAQRYRRPKSNDQNRISDFGHRASEFPNISLLLQALDLEESMNFSEVEKERLELVKILVDKLDEDSLSYLVNQSVNCRLGYMTCGEYYKFLKNCCEANGILLNKFNKLASYVRYVTIAESIDANNLFKELTKLEKLVQNSLAVTSEQKRLLAFNQSLTLLKNLTNHSMTTDDWVYYEKHREDILGVENVVAQFTGGEALSSFRIERRSNDTITTPDKLGNYNEPNKLALASVVTPFEDFCRYATQRNEVLIENLLKKTAGSRKEKAESNYKASSFPPSTFPIQPSAVSILVAGGFHTEGLTQILRQKDVSYIVITPKITEVPKETHYLDVFAREPLPIEKLFAGDIISLASQRLTAANAIEIPGAKLKVETYQSLYASLQVLINKIFMPSKKMTSTEE